jgi:hypothetical protein
VYVVTTYLGAGAAALLASLRDEMAGGEGVADIMPTPYVLLVPKFGRGCDES